eukprot:1065466-Alexandrium_andersonii.AAC.1
MQKYVPNRGSATDREIREFGIQTRASRVGSRTFYQVSGGTTSVLANKAVLLPFVPGREDVI